MVLNISAFFNGTVQNHLENIFSFLAGSSSHLHCISQNYFPKYGVPRPLGVETALVSSYGLIHALHRIKQSESVFHESGR